ncbi:MAG: STAS domain-containing protein [Nocardioidaceae bacterium]
MLTPRFVPARPPQGLEVHTDHRDRRLHVRLCGELDISTAHRLGAPELVLPDAPVQTVLLDLGRLTFCDVSGTHALVSYRDVHHELGRVVAVQHLRPNVLLALRALEVDHLFLRGLES